MRPPTRSAADAAPTLNDRDIDVIESSMGLMNVDDELSQALEGSADPQWHVCGAFAVAGLVRQTPAGAAADGQLAHPHLGLRSLWHFLCSEEAFLLHWRWDSYPDRRWAVHIVIAVAKMCAMPLQLVPLRLRSFKEVLIDKGAHRMFLQDYVELDPD